MSAKAEAKHHREKKTNPHCSLKGRAVRISCCLWRGLSLVEDNQSCDDAWHPSANGEDENNEY